MLRMPSTSLTRCVLLDLRPSFEQTRNRAGPHNSGHRSVMRYLVQQGLDIAIAADRTQWKCLADDWLRHHGLPARPQMPVNVFKLPGDKYLCQGAFHGQQLFFCDVSPSLHRSILGLDRTEGWRMKSFHGSSLARLLQCIVDTNWLWSSTFHLRVLLFQANGCGEHVGDLLSELPIMLAPFHQRKIVVEISVLPVAWSNEMKQLVTTLAC